MWMWAALMADRYAGGKARRLQVRRRLSPLAEICILAATNLTWLRLPSGKLRHVRKDKVS